MGDIKTFPVIDAGAIKGKLIDEITNSDDGKFFKYDNNSNTIKLASAGSGGDPVYYDIGDVSNNEVLFLLSDQYDVNFAPSVTVANSGNYIVEIYGANSQLLITKTLPSGIAYTFSLTKNTGVPSGLGWSSYKVRIRAENPSNAITQCSYGNANMLIKAKYGTTGLTTLSFSNCKYMNEVVLPSSLGNITRMEGMFQYCYLIETIVYPSTMNAVTSMQNAFKDCWALKNLTLPTSMTSLTGTALYNTFLNCYSLTSITLPNTLSGVTSMESMCSGCYSLASITNLSTATAITTMQYAFMSCYNLQSIVLPATMNSLTTMQCCFSNCLSLTSITMPTSMTAITGSGLSYFIQNCISLATLSTITTIKTDQQNVDFNTRLLSLGTFSQPTLRVSKINLSGISGSPSGLTSIDIDYANSTYGGSSPQIDISYCNLDATELDRIFTALPTATKTIKITGNPGVATCNPSIATAKNWTVTTT